MPVSPVIPVVIVLLGLALLFVVARCYSRFVILKSFGIDDACVVFGLFSAIAVAYFLVLGDVTVHYRGADQLDAFETTIAAKAYWGVLVSFCFSSMLTHSSAILQCLRFVLFGKMRIICWISLSLIDLFGTVSFFLIIFQCTPVHAYWDKGTPGGKCLDLRNWYYFVSTILVICDVVVVAVPIIMVKGLRMPRRQKIALSVVFAIGGFAAIISVIRLYYLTVTRTPQNTHKYDAITSIWFSVELNLGIICICVPAMKPVVKKFAPSLLSDKSGNGYGTGATSSDISGETLVLRDQLSESKESICVLEPPEDRPAADTQV